MQKTIDAYGHIPFEVFTARDETGAITGVMLTVPCRCGLSEADTLRVNGSVILAIRDRSVLPIDFPELSEQSRSHFMDVSRSGQQLAVAEFTAIGLLNAYFLNLQIA